MRTLFISIVYIFLALGAGLPAGRVAAWRRLSRLYTTGSLRRVRSAAEELADSLSPRDASMIVASTLLYWSSRGLTSVVAVAMSDRIAEEPKLFRNITSMILAKYPLRPASDILGPFVKGHEDLVNTEESVKEFLMAIAGAQVAYCHRPRETRSCSGAFAENLTWVLVTFPRTCSRLVDWLTTWYEEVVRLEPSSSLRDLKSIYLQMYPMPIILTEPGLMALAGSEESIANSLASTYASFPLKARLEVGEYVLWTTRLRDDLEFNSLAYNRALRWSHTHMVIPDRKECDTALARMLETDSFRTLSLTLQYGWCHKVPSWAMNTYLSSAPLSFSVLLVHGFSVGLGVERIIRPDREISQVQQLMAEFRPKIAGADDDATLGGRWDPCTANRKSDPRTYEWQTPSAEALRSLGDASDAVLLIRHMLYAQFAIPFDNSIIDSYWQSEEMDQAELPGMASVMLERHCLLRGKRPAYVIKGPKFVTSSSSSTSEIESSVVEDSSEFTSVTDTASSTFDSQSIADSDIRGISGSWFQRQPDSDTLEDEDDDEYDTLAHHDSRWSASDQDFDSDDYLAVAASDSADSIASDSDSDNRISTSILRRAQASSISRPKNCKSLDAAGFLLELATTLFSGGSNATERTQ